MAHHLYGIHLVLWSNAEGKLQYDDTGVRLAHHSHLSVAYSLVEQKMFGSLSRKHFGFAMPSERGVFTLPSSNAELIQMRVVPAYKPNYYDNHGVILGVEQPPKRLRYIRAYNPASTESFKRLGLDLGRSNLSIIRQA